MKKLTSPANYVGRFAPSPSGPLHFGSLVTALGSYLQAKANKGRWLVRIEDIDPPREIPGASDAILRCLEAHQLFWDDKVIYQSAQSELYNQKIEYLHQQGLTYFCQCTRAQLSSLTADQICHCAAYELAPDGCALRFKYQSTNLQFFDQLLGQVKVKSEALASHFAIKRKDGLFAYQLAVVVDDIQQGITEVARGADLLDATLYQIALYEAFNAPIPDFLHFPVVLSEQGKKLSKQNHAEEVSANLVESNLINALNFLGLSPPLEVQQDSPQNILQWAIAHWDLSQIGTQTGRIDNRIGQADSI
jgi:glutamyl-Q tRNA(Asp) synthetase